MALEFEKKTRLVSTSSFVSLGEMLNLSISKRGDNSGLRQKLCKDKCATDQELLRCCRKKGYINTAILLTFFSWLFALLKSKLLIYLDYEEGHIWIQTVQTEPVF